MWEVRPVRTSQGTRKSASFWDTWGKWRQMITGTISTLHKSLKHGSFFRNWQHCRQGPFWKQFTGFIIFYRKTTSPKGGRYLVFFQNISVCKLHTTCNLQFYLCDVLELLHKGKIIQKYLFTGKEIKAGYLSRGKFLVSRWRLFRRTAELIQPKPLVYWFRKCYAMYLMCVLNLYFFICFSPQPTCPPVVQSLTVELRSLGSSSPSSVFKTSYSAGKKRYRQINQFEFTRE